MLHLLQSDLGSDELKRLCNKLTPEDSVILMNDGIYLIHQLTQILPLPCACFAIISDCEMRGMVLAEGIEGIDMSGLLALTTQHASSASW